MLTLPTFVPFGGGGGELAPSVPPFMSEGQMNPDAALAGPDVTSVVIAGVGLFISHGVS